MEDSILNKYLDEIGRESLLTEAQECELSQRIRQGDQRALNRLVEANLRFVVAIARQYQGKGLSMEDLVSEGNIGLMKAAGKYDAGRGLRFVNYAVVFVRQQIERALKTESAELRVETRRDGQTRSVDAPLGSKTNMSLLSVLVDGNAPLADERVYNASVERAVMAALQALDERRLKVVNAYFGIGQENLTMAEIAQDMGLKRERVRQIRDHAVRRMKKIYKQRLADFQATN
jgi:RNA polymerase primary sigma factor